MLVFKKYLVYDNSYSSCPGGGTVEYVTHKGHKFLERTEEREEAGTPDIVGAIRAGLALQVRLQLSRMQELFYRRANRIAQGELLEVMFTSLLYVHRHVS